MGVDVTALASFLLFCFSPVACWCCQNETCLVQANAPILPSRQTQVWKSVMASAALCLLPSLLFISQLLIMGCFSRMKTPGKEFGWKQAEHWITTCCEMGYVVDVVFVVLFLFLFCRFVCGPSLEANILFRLREKGRPNCLFCSKGNLFLVLS